MKINTLLLVATVLGVQISATPTPSFAEDASLSQAFKKEFAFLETQKNQLAQRLKKLREETNASANKLTLEIDGLEQALLSLESETVLLNDNLKISERQAETNQANTEILASTFEQAKATLSEYSINLDNDVAYVTAKNERKLERLYEIANESLVSLASVQHTDGRYYLNDGTEIQGKIIKIGRIASFGVSEKGSGTLAPAGNGQLKLWHEPSSDIANALLSGTPPPELKLFLYESLNKGVEEQQENGITETMNDGGIIGWVIVLLGVLALTMIVRRILFLRAAGAATETIEQEVGTRVAKGDIPGALEFCRTQPGSTARVVAATLRNLDRERDHIEDIVSESILHESATLNRFATFIIVIAAVSPLLGLLGTVTGMISTFDVITEFGTGDPKLLSGGISTALITTELGLIVAIPTLIFGNLLNGWSNRIKDNMEKAALRVINVSKSDPNKQSVQKVNRVDSIGGANAVPA